DHAQMTAPMLVFSGRAGSALGDSSRVTVVLYRGAAAVGRPLTTILTAQASGGSWSINGPPRLVPGLYTAVATQPDDAGHTGRSSPRTFRLVPVPHVIGPLVTLNRARLASVRIGCTAVRGNCTGDVL